MIAHWDIVQGTEAWHRIKYGKIGGSIAKGLFVKSDTLLDELLSARLEPFYLEDDDYQSLEMQRGQDLEPLARAQMSQYIGAELLQCGWLQCEEHSLLGISPDGITQDLTIAAEIKAPGRKKHTTTIREDQIPLDHIDQCVHYFTVNPLLQKLYFGSFRPESVKPLFVKLLTRETPVNLGTKAKPVVKPVAEWVALAKTETKKLDDDITVHLTKLNNDF